MRTLRTFLAVELPGEARAGLAVAIEALRRAENTDVRWANADALHLTLKFCGEFPEERLEELFERCAARLGSVLPFDVTLGGLGAFPSAHDARVIWMGVTAGAGELARLARRLEAACTRLGVERERRPYRAHLTLGRLREPRKLAIERLAAPDAIAFRVEDVVCFESRLSPRGAQHIPLARLPLGQPGEVDLAPET